MNEYTECEAYRHLLQVAENIIYSIHPDQKILNKYDQLKKSVLAKITKDKDKDVHKLMIETYKRIIDNSIKAISSFEAQLQEKMQRKNYNQIILKMNQEIQDYFSQLQQVQKQSNSKTKLLVKQQIGTLKYQYDQLDSKYQNLGLLIQVHKKMHQIIIEATKSQQKRSSQQTNYKQKINNLQNMIGEIDQASEFIKFHKITQDKFQKYKMASRKLNQLLFENK